MICVRSCVSLLRDTGLEGYANGLRDRMSHEKDTACMVTYGTDVNGQLIGASMSVWIVSLPGANRAGGPQETRSAFPPDSDPQRPNQFPVRWSDWNMLRGAYHGLRFVIGHVTS